MTAVAAHATAIATIAKITLSGTDHGSVRAAIEPVTGTEIAGAGSASSLPARLRAATGRRFKARTAGFGSAVPSCGAAGPDAPGGGVPPPEADGIFSQY